MKLTLLKASEEFGAARETIRRGLVTNGVEVTPGGKYTIAQIHLALTGDVKVATARDKMASALARERENRIADGDLISVSDHEAWQRKTLLPIRQRLDALPTTMAQRCNPTDPEFARQALSGWVKESLELIRSDILK